MPFAFSPALIARLIGGLALLLIIGWFFRIDQLRGQHHDDLITIQKTVQTKAGKKLAFDKLSSGIVQIADERDAAIKRYQADEIMIEQQNAAIDALSTERARLQAISTAAEQKARDLMAQRQTWIATAAQAATRQQRGTDAQELEECNAALDDIHRSGF